MDWLIGVAESVSADTVRYFSSALAQSAAALVSVVAVFSVFRLQSDRDEITERYRQAAYWIVHGGSMKDGLTMPRTKILHLLKEAVVRRGNLWQSMLGGTPSGQIQEQKRGEIEALLAAISNAQAMHGVLVHRMVLPLSLWGIAFSASMILLGLSQQLVGFLGFTSMGLSLVAVFLAALATKCFVQKCLESPSEKEEGS